MRRYIYFFSLRSKIALISERKPFEDNFESESEDHVDEEVEYELDGIEIIKHVYILMLDVCEL